jgi:phenylalanyl-tRNA synthetase beta chain
MKVLQSWLREFAPIEGDPTFLADALSSLGLAVEDLVMLGEGLDGIVLAQVLELRKHPNADRMQLVDVDLGDGHALQVCCGAFNMSVGDVIPLATVGTVMPNGMKIERAKKRGEWSNGMLCSATELGLSNEANGIYILDETLFEGGVVPLGAPFADALGIERDVLFDLDVTSNRPDALSVVGVARDLAAHLGVPFALPELGVATSGVSALRRATIEISDASLCGRFVARVLDHIAVGPSPAWMQRRLAALGMRPINNVVDASNYVMLELGQPSHAFDLAKVAGTTLRVRRARPNERIVTLDGISRTLTPADGVIADGDDVAVAIAGVMGGASTEIDSSSTSVLLELAWWDPMSIALTSRRLGLRSEASTRFERGTDPLIPERAALRLAQLLAPSGVTLAPDALTVEGRELTPTRVHVRTGRVNGLLGTSLSPEEIRGAIEPIGFVCVATSDGHDVTVPSWRPDTTIEVDVIEEVARHIGFDQIGKTVPQSPLTGALTPRQSDRRAIRRVLAGLGLDEALPVPFLAPGDHTKAGVGDSPLSVTNPLVSEESVMRASLRPGLLRSVSFNESHRNLGVSLFEIGHVYRHPIIIDGVDPPRLPDEREHLAVALAGQEAPAAVHVWSTLADAIAAPDYELIVDSPSGLHPTRTARIEIGGVAIGWVGEIDPDATRSFEVSERVAWLELDLDTLLDLPHGVRQFRAISRFPSSDIDLAFTVADTVAAAAIERALRRGGADLVVDLALFDVFRGSSLPEGTRSLAYRLRLQALDHTLTDEEIAGARAACIAAVESSTGASLRA